MDSFPSSNSAVYSSYDDLAIAAVSGINQYPAVRAVSGLDWDLAVDAASGLNAAAACKGVTNHISSDTKLQIR